MNGCLGLQCCATSRGDIAGVLRASNHLRRVHADALRSVPLHMDLDSKRLKCVCR